MIAAELRALRDAGHEGGGPYLQRIERIVETPVVHFAYPYGTANGDVLNGVMRGCYRAGFTTRSSALLNASNPLLLPRIRYDVNEAASGILRRIRIAGG